ncbi:MAG: hypothetical protein FWD61_12125 [Phycisphaerales bacterium]|nr:hypothetical protein [Phycisphaerales bacterium]
MPDVIPFGPVAVAIDALRTLVANLPFFQTWTGSADATVAIKRIFTGEVGWQIVGVTIAGGIITVKTREPHSVVTGDTITIEGASLGPQSELSIAGTYQVADVPDATTVLIATTLRDVLPPSPYPDGGEIPDFGFLFPFSRPLAVVSEDKNAANATSVGTGGAFVCSGTLDIMLEADVSAAYVSDAPNALAEARSATGQFLQDLASTQGTADLMCLNNMQIVLGPEFTARPEQDDNTARFERWRAIIHVTWGIS